ncbi:MAG TPA: helix-turn-helix transcriptional regulator, partial [Methylophilaceae bacterium]|nr:helix-turn-helix transcriptional regulator [Methylophilaceae bacterium]
MSDISVNESQQLWQAKMLEQGVEQLGQAMMIVSSRGEVVFYTKAAENILAANRGLKIVDGQLLAELMPDNKRLQEAIQLAIQEKPGECGVFNVFVHRDDYVRPISLTISKMVKNMDERRQGHHALVLIKDLNLNQEFWTDRLKDEYHLSPREVECVSL